MHAVAPPFQPDDLGPHERVGFPIGLVCYDFLLGATHSLKRYWRKGLEQVIKTLS